MNIAFIYSFISHIWLKQRLMSLLLNRLFISVKLYSLCQKFYSYKVAFLTIFLPKIFVVHVLV